LEENPNVCPASVAHVCNPSYSAGRDQADHSSKPVPEEIDHENLSRKNATHKRASGVAQVVERLPIKREAEFKPQYCQNKKLVSAWCGHHHTLESDLLPAEPTGLILTSTSTTKHFPTIPHPLDLFQVWV
jgi:hypothetical protein